MKEKIGMWLDLGIGSLNYILINYALSNMAMLFRSHWLFILFFASEIWVVERYWRMVREKTGRRWLSTMLVIGCYLIHIGILYVVGRVVGTVGPFCQG